MAFRILTEGGERIKHIMFVKEFFYNVVQYSAGNYCVQ